MRSGEAEQALRQYASVRGVNIDAVDTETLIRTMAGWYKSERADDADLGADGDMLLFQWGTYRWRGTGPEFEFDVTRQFIVNGLVDDDAFFQLSWTALFRPSNATAALGEGNRWCHHPDDVDDFLGFILGSDAATFATVRSPDRVEIAFGPAG